MFSYIGRKFDSTINQRPVHCRQTRQDEPPTSARCYSMPWCGRPRPLKTMAGTGNGARAKQREHRTGPFPVPVSGMPLRLHGPPATPPGGRH